jgi:Tol biopolymer transport system component
MQDSAKDRNRLESWKQIAAYLNKSERTVRRWHETEGLPVHKHQHQQKGSVWAYPDELQQWLATRIMPPASPETPPAKVRRYWPWSMAATVAMAGLGVILLTPRAPTNIKPDPIPLTALPGSESGASVSPDGKQIAFVWGQADRPENGIYIKAIGTHVVTPIAAGRREAAYLYSPAWSPDGRAIAFLERTSSSETWLCVIRLSGGQPQRLKQIAAAPALYFGNHRHIAWTGDSRWIIVPMSLPSQHGIYRVSAASGTTVAITEGKSVYAPTLSPNGRRLVSLRHEGLPITSEEILLHELNVDGTVASGPVVVYKGHSGSSGITWLADSKHLVLCKSEPTLLGVVAHLFQFSAVAGGQMKPIGGNGCMTVTMAPDGSLVYGVTTTPRSKMLRTNLQPPEPAEEFLPSSRYDAFPRFSPDGKQVAFYSNRSGDTEIWVSRQDGTALRQVAEGTRAYSGPAWSPNSDRVVYVPEESLAISDLSGGKPQKIDLAGSTAQHPVWSPDGTAIYYTAKSHLWRVRPDGTGREMLRELPPILDLHADPDGQHLYYSRSGQPHFTLCRMRLDGGAEEIIQSDLDLPFFAVAKRALYLVRAGINLYAQALSGGDMVKVGSLLTPSRSRGRHWETLFTVSPDGRTVIWVSSAPEETDIAMWRYDPGGK